MIKATAEEGMVVSMLPNRKVQVYLPEVDYDIEVFADELRLLPSKKTPPPADTEKAPPVAPSAPGDLGIQLAFEPVYQGDDIPEKYLIYLLNPSEADIIYQVQLNLAGEEAFREHGKIAGGHTVSLGDLYYDELNETPVFAFDCCLITPDGTGPRHKKNLRIKAKQFFKNIRTVPMLGKTAHLYQVFSDLKTGRKNPLEGDLKTYTKKNIKPRKSFHAGHGAPVQHEVKARAEFEVELDLHIDALVDDPTALKKSEILQLQLRRFEEYLDQAVRLGVDRVFIIHGVGEGKLRKALHSRLITQPYVRTFKNEYHHKYGFGATEVIFD